MSAPRRPSRNDRRRTAVRRAVGVLIALLCVAAGAGYLYFHAQDGVRPIDKATLCPTDAEGPRSITAILIDRTDSFDPTQEAAIRDRLNALKDQTQQYDLIEVYAVDSTEKKVLKPEFSMCNPGSAQGVSKWTSNPQLVADRWQHMFADPLQHMFDSILSTETAAISPIMESIQSVAVTRLAAQDKVAKSTPRRLVVISDLLQYVPDYSQYKSWATFKQFAITPYYQSVKADLTGITVDVWYVRRQKTLNIQGKRHVDFWRNYLSDQGATVDDFWYVPGL